MGQTTSEGCRQHIVTTWNAGVSANAVRPQRRAHNEKLVALRGPGIYASRL